MAIQDYAFGGLLDEEDQGIVLPQNLQSMSTQEKAQAYNNLLALGFSNAEIRNAVESQLGAQSNANWGALQDIAAGLRSGGATGATSVLQTEFGDPGSWTFGQGATYQENMITAPDAYFQRGGDVVVSDELFWNPNSPTGDALKAKVQQAKSQGQRAGVVITPYAVFQGKASNQQLINEIKNSGVDFVALDPYLGFGVPKNDLLNWTKEFIPQLNELGLGVKLVTQDFAKAGMEQETRQYNQELMSIPGVSEYVSFGLEDAPDLQGSPEWVSLSAPQAQIAQATPKEPEIMMAQSAPDSGAGAVTQGLLQPTQASVSPPQIAGQATSMVAPSLLSAQEAAELREAQAMGGAGFGRPTDIVATSNLAPVDIAYLAQGKGMFGNPLLGYDPTSPLSWALQSGIGIPATQFLTQAGMNLLGLTDASAIAQDASQLAGQGLSESQIVSTLKASGVPTGAAVAAAEGAVGGASVFSIAQDIADTAYRAATVAPSVSQAVSDVAAASGATQSVPVAGGLLGGGVADVLAALPGVQVTGSTQQTTAPVVPTLPAGDVATQQVQVADRVGQATASEDIGGALTTVAPQAPTQQVQVQSQVDPDTASQIISVLTGTPVSVAGSQTVGVTDSREQQISQDTAAQVLSAITNQQVNVGTSRVQETPSDVLTNLLAPTETVPVTSAVERQPARDTAAAVTSGLLATESVPVQSQRLTTDDASQIISALAGQPVVVADQSVPVTSTTQRVTPQDAASIISSVIGQQVTVTSQPVREDVTPVTQMIPTAATQQVQVTAPTPKFSDLIAPASVIPAVIQAPPPDRVTIEDRYIPPPAPAPIITAPAGPPPAPIQTPRGEIPVEDRIIPREQFQPITGSVPLTGLGLGLALPVAAAGASLLTQDQGGPSFDQAYADTILGAPRPVYGGQPFTPFSNYFQIAPTNVYNPFATVAPFGAGRFGGFAQPITLPRGLI